MMHVYRGHVVSPISKYQSTWDTGPGPLTTEVILLSKEDNIIKVFLEANVVKREGTCQCPGPWRDPRPSAGAWSGRPLSQRREFGAHEYYKHLHI